MTEHYVIIEKLKESLGKRKISAAVFYTFNFDSKFFENYILPFFLPDVPFSNNEIQNAILWRRYSSELPPVTVYCDFHAKSPEAPSLKYEVRAIDLKSLHGNKPCFHPKVSFLLLDDNSLLILTGSNNISISGWCKNEEIVSVVELNKRKFFPYYLKHAIKNFLSESKSLVPLDLSVAEVKVESFLKQRIHTKHINLVFYSSFSTDFRKLLDDLKGENLNKPFSRIEIISPYISDSKSFIEDALKYSEFGKIYLLTPYDCINETSVTEQNYIKYCELGVIWSDFVKPGSEKGFRFNHSKVYRFQGEKNMYTVVGSVNFTEAGWKGSKRGGNVESAIVYIQPVAEFKPWLKESVNPDLIFAKSNSDETSSDERFDVPDIKFSIDWLEKKLIYESLKLHDFKGKIKLGGKNCDIKIAKCIKINLNEEQLTLLAENSIIHVQEYGTMREILFYPTHINLESKPIGIKLKLNDKELLELWSHISANEKVKNEITDLLDRYLTDRIDLEDDLIGKVIPFKSTINMIASHINAIIKLEETIFKIPSRISGFSRSAEITEYYLFANNIDTISGYRNLLNNMSKDGVLLPSVHWFLLNLLRENLYQDKKVIDFFKTVRVIPVTLKDRLNKTRESLIKEIKDLKKKLNPDEIKVSDWVYSHIKE
jgi:hypothetical protein